MTILRPSARCHALADFAALARRRLPRAVFGFAAHGADDEQTLRRNRTALESVTLLPRLLHDLGERTQAVELFGAHYASPFGIAPMGGAALFAFDADRVLAEAARDRGIPFVLSGASSVPLEQIAQAAPGSWYQAYLAGDESGIAEILERVERAGFRVLVVTADAPISGNRDRDRRLGFTMPVRIGPRIAADALLHPRWLAGTVGRTLWRRGVPRFENFGVLPGGPLWSRAEAPERAAARLRFTWRHFEIVRRLWPGTLVLKGVLRAGDASTARDVGADGLIVSNHGGRQLDGVPAAFEALGDIAAAVPDLPLIVDGGIRRGTDVIKALAAGADFVLAGRPFLYAAAVDGVVGVYRAIDILRREIDVSQALLGYADVTTVDAGCLVRGPGSGHGPGHTGAPGTLSPA